MLTLLEELSVSIASKVGMKIIVMKGRKIVGKSDFVVTWYARPWKAEQCEKLTEARYKSRISGDIRKLQAVTGIQS